MLMQRKIGSTAQLNAKGLLCERSALLRICSQVPYMPSTQGPKFMCALPPQPYVTSASRCQVCMPFNVQMCMWPSDRLHGQYCFDWTLNRWLGMKMCLLMRVMHPTAGLALVQPVKHKIQ